MNNIYANDTCELFRKISKSVWDKIIFNHSVETEVSEIGLTNDIIAILRNHSSRKRNISIWANKGWKENIYGSDIDIFIERSKGMYVWYALQAKVLKLKKDYDVITKQQWEKLRLLHDLSGCITKFLLYNGNLEFQCYKKDICNNSFHSHQFGCSLVKPDIIRILSKKSNPTFKDIHPKYAHPWRTMVCCNKPQESRLFSVWQIKEAIRYYPKRLTNSNVLSEYQDLSEKEMNKQTDLPRIRNLNEEVDRSPSYGIVITDTFSSDNSKEKILKLTEGNLNIPFDIGEENAKKEKQQIRKLINDNNL